MIHRLVGILALGLVSVQAGIARIAADVEGAIGSADDGGGCFDVGGEAEGFEF